MTKLAANLTMLFNEQAFLDRFEAAARAGFRGVEFLFPYAFHADQIADKLNTDEIPTARGGAQWRPSSVSTALGYRQRSRRHPAELPTLDGRQRRRTHS